MNCPSRDPHTKRIHELVRDGYIVLGQGKWLLTEKGWTVLSAYAEPPIQKPARITPRRLSNPK